MKDFLRINLSFLTAFCLVFAAIGIALLCASTNEIHLALNSFHTAFGDLLMKYYTPVGEWIPYVVVFLLLFYKAGDSLFLLSSLLGSGLLTQIVKHLLRAPRPAVVFDIAHHPDALPLVEGVRLAMSNSFPSGHTTSFFAFFLVLSCIVCRQRAVPQPMKHTISLLFFTLALLGGFSRIYLSQHFLLDVFAGGIIGTLATTGVYMGFKTLEQKHPAFYHWHIVLPTGRNRQAPPM